MKHTGKLFLTVAFSAIMSAKVLANESYFLVNQYTNKGKINVSFGQVDQKRTVVNNRTFAGEVQSKATRFGLTYMNSLADLSSYQIGSGFQMRNITSSSESSFGGENSTGSAYGLTNLKGQYRQGYDVDKYVWYWSAGADLSLARNENPTDVNSSSKKSGNNFSGYSTLTGAIGIESYISETEIPVGAELSLNQYIFNSGTDNPDNREAIYNNLSPRVRGFIELPIDKKWNTGLDVTYGRQGLGDLDFFNSSKNETGAGFFVQHNLDKGSSLNLKFSALDQKFPVNDSTQAWGLNFQKTLE
jgi:hypothetical protein